MHFKKYSIIISLILSACIEDKGSYEYNPINDISVSGIEEVYYVSSGITQLQVAPEISGTKYADEDRFEYNWYVCQKDAYFEHHHTPLASGKDLDTKITLAPGTYTLYFTVLDKGTDMEFNFPCTLVVSTELLQGFYIFGDKPDGIAGMDFLSTPTGGDTVLIRDIFTNKNRIAGAEDLLFSGNNKVHASLENLWAITSNGSYKIESSIQKSSVFDVDENYDESTVFFPTLPIKHPMKVMDEFPRQTLSPTGSTGASVHYGRGVITEDAIFVGNVAEGYETYANPVNRYSIASTELFTPYSKAFYRSSSTIAWMVLFYDYTNECFCALRNYDGALSNATTCIRLEDKASDVFPWNQQDRTLLFGENDPKNGYSYALMKDLNDESKYYIYRFTIFRTTNLRKNGSYEIDLTTVPELKQASSIRFFCDQPFVLYSVGSRLYAYNYSTKQAPILLKDFTDDITFFSFIYEMTLEGWMPKYTINLFVATYSDANGGTIRRYATESTPNSFGIKLRNNCEWNTDIKVKKIECRNSNN